MQEIALLNMPKSSNINQVRDEPKSSNINQVRDEPKSSNINQVRDEPKITSNFAGIKSLDQDFNPASKHFLSGLKKSASISPTKFKINHQPKPASQETQKLSSKGIPTTHSSHPLKPTPSQAKVIPGIDPCKKNFYSKKIFF
jgi:hypothetical protein